MEKFTQDFIFRVKQPQKQDEDMYDAAVNFMSENCDCPKSVYTDSRMYKIVKNFFADYISTCDNHNSLFFDYTEYFHYKEIKSFNIPADYVIYTTKDLTLAMLYALQNTQVRGKDKLTGEYYYINGFVDDDTEDLKADHKKRRGGIPVD